jgi:hypothetical protein
MKTSTLPSALLLAGLLGVAPVFGEGEVGSQAFQWSGLSDLAPTPTTYSLAQYQGKVVLLVVFQYNCGGCVANAPRTGRLVDTLDRGADSAKFQALGTEINVATYANIQTYRNSLTNSGSLTLNFPLMKVPNDTAILTDGVGTKWKRYNSYRDVYFVINHLGFITARVEGNRTSLMTSAQYQSIRTALNTALAAVPASIGPSSGTLSGFRADHIGRGYRFHADGGVAGVVSLRISDLQGRAVREFSLTSSAPEAVWDGTGIANRALSYGLYFLRIEGGGLSMSRQIALLP